MSFLDYFKGKKKNTASVAVKVTGGSFSGAVRVGDVLDLLPVALLVRD